MKKIIIGVVLLVLIISTFLIYSHYPKKPFDSLNIDEIKSVKVTLAPPGRTIDIAKTEDFLDRLNEITVYNRKYFLEDMVGQTVEYDINLTNGKYIHISVINPYIIIDGKAFKGKYSALNELTTHANSLLNDLLLENHAEEFYVKKNTSLSDESKVSALINGVNLTPFPIEKILFEDGVKIFFKVSDRAKHRFINEVDFHKMSALVFSLVPDLNEIRFFVFDNYAQKLEPDYAFGGRYVKRELLDTYKGMEKFNSKYIESSTQTLESFKEFCGVLSKIEGEEEPRAFLNEVYSFIGSDYEITVNSAIAADLKLDDKFIESKDAKTLNKIFDINLKDFKDKKVRLIKYDIRNYKNNERKKCAFLHFDYISEGHEIIGKKILTDKEIKLIREIIVKYN